VTATALPLACGVVLLVLLWLAVRRQQRGDASAAEGTDAARPRPGGIALLSIDHRHRVVEANAAAAALVGKPLKQIVRAPVQRALGELPELLAMVTEPSHSRGQIFTGRTASTRRCHEVRVTLLGDDPRRSKRLVSIRDVTSEHLDRARLQHRAHFDSLTGLANRGLFLDTLAESIDEARKKNKQVILLCLDLDKLKDINDSLGHPAGDELIRTVAHRLRQESRNSNLSPRNDKAEPPLIARIGGDEFAILYRSIHSDAQATAAAERVIEVVAEPVNLGSQTVWGSASVGIARFPDDGDDPERLVKSADAALYQAKRTRRGSFAYYQPELDATNLRRVTLETALRGAIERNELELHYQPKIVAGTHQVVGCEALLRWTNDRLGAVPPKEFIPIAEASGIIIDLGSWVIERACRQIRRWMDDGRDPVPVSVNVSSHQLQRTNLEQIITEALRFQDVDPRLLEVELTESVLLQDDEETARRLRDLQAIGVRIALDDFGTGYSALSYLTRFPLDVLKMDRAFVRDIDSDPAAAGIAAAVVDMAHSLGLEVVAEGVDSEEQVARLRDMGCDQIQGFIFSQAVPASEFARYLERTDRRADGSRAREPDRVEAPEQRPAQGAAGDGARVEPRVEPAPAAEPAEPDLEADADLPAEPDLEADADLPAEPPVAELDAATCYALVVDDAQGSLALFTLRLNQLGIPALYARDVDEGILFAAQEPGRIRALVISPGSPVADARKVAQQIAALSKGLHPTFVLIGDDSQLDVAPLRELAPSWTLHMPVDDKALQHSVAAAMGVRLREGGAPRCALETSTWIGAPDGDRAFGTMTSLSARGAFIEMTGMPRVGTRLELEFELSEKPIKCGAKVLYQRRGGSSAVDAIEGIGIEFLELDPEAQETICDEVEARATQTHV
jgi:diguanylate cyclase (GGDEF)-like protein